MTTLLLRRLRERLDQRHRESLHRQRLMLESPQGARVRLRGRDYLCFCSNDYLGLANHPRLVASMRRAAGEYGVGSGASHLVVGHSRYHHELEEALAEFTGRRRALLFSSGYMANLGVITSLAGRGNLVLEDRLNHASLLDAGLLSGARLRRFRHNAVEHLRALLRAADSASGKLVAVDGVFSMDGDRAPLRELASACAAGDATLMVDDAHGFGVLGPGGAGSVAAYGLTSGEVPVLMGTLGKALGCFGAFVAGDDSLIEGLLQFARSYVYTTALPPAVAAASLTALRLLDEEAWRRERLDALIKRFRAGAATLGVELMDSATAIQPLLAGDPSRALRLSARLEELGILVSAIRPPTVPRGAARLRITLSAAHSENDLDRLLESLAACRD